MQTLIKLVYPTVSKSVKYAVWFMIAVLFVAGFLYVAHNDKVLLAQGLIH